MHDIWNSPSKGQVNFDDIAVHIAHSTTNAAEDTPFRLIIGTDSTLKASGAEFVVAIILHRVGRGGVYYWKRVDSSANTDVNRAYRTLRNRIYQEALLSLETANEIITLLKDDYALLTNLEIHVDVGRVGATREIIQEVVGMVRGNGFEVKTKPEAFAASSVADRHV